MSEMTTKMTKEEAQEKHWYIKINKRESGPYRYSEILLMIHNQDVKEGDMITCRGLGGWKNLSDFEHFGSSNVKAYFEEMDLDPEDHEAIHFRKSMRVPFKEAILIVSGNQVFKAVCLDVSTGGCMIKVKRGQIPMDSQIKIHIYNNDDMNCPAFNLRGTVTRNIAQKRESEAGTLYDHLGVEFSGVKKSQRDILQNTLRDIVFNYRESDSVFKRAA